MSTVLELEFDNTGLGLRVRLSLPTEIK